MAYTYAYPRPAVTTDAILISKEKSEVYILLIERANEPYKGQWALPGGFVDMDEELEEACSRELKEETSVDGVPLQEFATFGAVNRDPRGRTISIVFWSILDSRPNTKSGDDAANVKWFNLNDLPSLAFDHEIIIARFRQEKLDPH